MSMLPKSAVARALGLDLYFRGPPVEDFPAGEVLRIVVLAADLPNDVLARAYKALLMDMWGLLHAALVYAAKRGFDPDAVAELVENTVLQQLYGATPLPLQPRDVLTAVAGVVLFVVHAASQAPLKEGSSPPLDATWRAAGRIVGALLKPLPPTQRPEAAEVRA